MVIRCKRPDQILSSLWGDMHDLSQILHIPGNDSIFICSTVYSMGCCNLFESSALRCQDINFTQLRTHSIQSQPPFASSDQLGWRIYDFASSLSWYCFAHYHSDAISIRWQDERHNLTYIHRRYGPGRLDVSPLWQHLQSVQRVYPGYLKTYLFRSADTEHPICYRKYPTKHDSCVTFPVWRPCPPTTCKCLSVAWEVESVTNVCAPAGDQTCFG